ncbi:MAG: SurA N-terminal domain-containing protein [Rickettsiaceae bacterium]
MKYLISIILLLVSFEILAGKQDIVAIVNDSPITMYEFNARKQMAIILNKIDNSTPQLNTQLNKDILNVLIEEELLNQYSEKHGNKVSKAEIDSAIFTIEERNKMPKGYLLQHMRELGVSVDSFRKQIKSELIKYNVINILSNSVSVSPKELDIAVINSGYDDFDITAWQFTSLDSNETSLKQMKKLSKRLSSCNKLEDKLYNNFASSTKIDSKLNDLNDKTKSVILDTKKNSSSEIYQEDNKFKLIFVCTKKSSISGNDINKVKTFLSNNKMSRKTDKFFKDLKSKAYIKILLDNK